MFVAALFWLSTLVPGYALLRRLKASEAEGGLPATIALSALGTLTLLTPFSLVGYVAELPVRFFATAYVVLVVLAMLDLTWTNGWRTLGRVLLAGVTIEGFIVAYDLLLASMNGALCFDFETDAMFHLGRIRHLVTYGLTNQDPYFEFFAFCRYYHTNIYHALQAAGVQISRSDPFAVWLTSLLWVKLLIVGGTYTLGWCVFQRPWAAWLAGLVPAAALAPITYSVYPNNLSMYWLVPLMLAFGVQVCLKPGDWRVLPRFAAGAVVLGQIHSLYAVFAGVLLAPTLIGLIFWRLVRRQSATVPTLAIVALWLGAPFALISRYPPRTPTPARVVAEELISPVEDTEPAPRFTDRFRNSFWNYADGTLQLMPRHAIYGHRTSGLVAIASGAVMALLLPRRRAALAVVIATATAATILFVPWLCALAVEVLGGAWIVLRLRPVFVIALGVLVAGQMAYLLEPLTHTTWGGPWFRRRTGQMSD